MPTRQTFNGVLLPLILVVMLRLVNDRRVMRKYTNRRFFNVLAWAIVVTLIALTATLLITSLFPGFLNGG